MRTILGIRKVNIIESQSSNCGKRNLTVYPKLPFIIKQVDEAVNKCLKELNSGTIITGSYNWITAAETRNDENALIEENNRLLASSYTKLFNEMWQREK